ncbi:hypothetical protein [Avibacterium paragallinarum]|nr:hypothetical protein [Avibacterium paragallinarum]QZP14824.1 hypothetical protein K5O18_08295 [Avibacterium paragallinarum]WAL56757.1 hypothetical protein OY678_12715 [Avibacterium paragallinarum]
MSVEYKNIEKISTKEVAELLAKISAITAICLVGILYLVFFALYFLGHFYHRGFAAFAETPWYTWMLLSYAILASAGKSQIKKYKAELEQRLDR